MRLSKKFAAIAITATVALTASAAFAFWSSSGSGIGSGSTATTAALVNATQTSTVSAMHPGDTAQSLNGTFDNLGEAPAYVASVTASISSVTGGAGACDASDFTLAGAVMTVGHTVDDGSTWGGATLKFNNSLIANQDGCKGATVNLAYAVSGV